MKKIEKYEKLDVKIELPLKFTKKETKVICEIKGKEFNVTSKVSDQVSFDGQESVEGKFSTSAIIYIKLNRSKNFEVVSGDNDFEMTLSDVYWEANNKVIDDPSVDPEYYKINSLDQVNEAIISHLNSQLASGELDHLITRNDGEPWSVAEAKMALEIYLRTAHSAEYSEQMDMIKAYINNGYLNRSLPSVRMMVHGMCAFDEDHQNSGLENLGKVFRQVWDAYQAGDSTGIDLNRSL